VNNQRATIGASRARALARKFKERPCADCGNTWPYFVMQVDHVPDRGAKTFSMSWTTGDPERGLRRSQGVTLDELQAELAKCDPVCANCHAIREHDRASARRL
jgi:hypothetical protein